VALLCNSAARNLKGVVCHIGSVHAHGANFHVTCGLQGCPRTYTNFHSYKKHMYSRHRDTLEVESSPTVSGEQLPEHKERATVMILIAQHPSLH